MDVLSPAEQHTLKGKRRASKRLFMLCSGFLILVFVWIFSSLRKSPMDLFPEFSAKKRHIHDGANFLPEYDIQKFEEYTNLIFNESDIDIHFFFMENAGDKTIDEIAVEKVQELGIGGESREERGVLLLYDVGGKKLRIEVGYGLEEYFPDAFVGYLVHDHTRHFFQRVMYPRG